MTRRRIADQAVQPLDRGDQEAADVVRHAVYRWEAAGVEVASRHANDGAGRDRVWVHLATRVRLVETAPSKIEWPEEQKAKYGDHSSHGWEIHLAHLEDYVSGQPTRHETSA